jgi:hypothetical protein
MPETSGLPVGEVTPPLQPDFGHVFLDVVLPCSVEHAYKLMFSNSVVGACAWTEGISAFCICICILRHIVMTFSAHPLACHRTRSPGLRKCIQDAQDHRC